MKRIWVYMFLNTVFLQKTVSLDILYIYQKMRYSNFHKKKHDSILYEYSVKQRSYINQYIQFYMFWPDKHFSAGQMSSISCHKWEVFKPLVLSLLNFSDNLFVKCSTADFCAATLHQMPSMLGQLHLLASTLGMRVWDRLWVAEWMTADDCCSGTLP